MARTSKKAAPLAEPIGGDPVVVEPPIQVIEIVEEPPAAPPPNHSEARKAPARRRARSSLEDGAAPMEAEPQARPQGADFLNGHFVEFTTQTETLHRQLREVGQEMAAIVSEARQAKEEIHALREVPQEARPGLEELETLRGQLGAVRQELATVVEKANDAKGTIHGLLEEREEVRQGMEELRQQFHLAQEQFLRDVLVDSEQLHKELDASSEQMKEVRRLFREACDKVFGEFTEQLGKAQREIHEGKQLLQGLPQQAEEFHRRFSEVLRQLSVAELRLVDVEQLSRARRQEQDAAEQESRALKQRLEEVRKETAEAVRQLSSLQKGLQEAEQRLNALQAVERAVAEHATADLNKSVTEGVPSEGRNRLGLTVGSGVVVSEVLPDSPMAQAGLLPGDVINSVNGVPVFTGPALRDAIHALKEGEGATLAVSRGETQIEIKAHFQPATAEGGGDWKNRLGATVDPAVVVAEVLPGMTGALAGLARGDVLHSVNGAQVFNGEELRQIIQALPERAAVVLRVSRGNEMREIKAPLDEGTMPMVPTGA